MKRKQKVAAMPKLPEHLTDNLEKVRRGLFRKPINSNFAKEWKVSEEEAQALLEYFFDAGMIELKWLPEKNALCFVEQKLLN
jgi:hypothetical protein